jgi:hypothetical protein
MYGDIRDSYHRAMAEEFSFLPSAIVVGEYTDARGTEAVKLSVKLLSGLTLIALVAVAVVGLSHSASAAADGKVYVTNKASKLTTEPGQNIDDDGRLTATTVYGTYATLKTGTSARDIVNDSDKLIVTVIDSDLNVTSTTQTAAYVLTNAAGDTDILDVAGGGFDVPGDQVRVTLTGTSSAPIVGEIGDINIVLASDGTTVVTNITVKSINYVGNGSAPAIITLGLDTGSAPGDVDIIYPTSQVDTLTVGIKSVVDSTGTSLLLTESGRNTGRFEGTIQVVEFIAGSVTAGVTNTSIPASGGPVTVTYNDAATSGSAVNVTRSATLSIDTTTPTVTVATPTHNTESQNRLPSFSGTAVDAQSGLDVDSFKLVIDETNDPTNSVTHAIEPSTGALNGTSANIDTAALGSDGDSSISWAFAQVTQLPTGLGSGVPDNLIDFQGRVSDLAGNIGFSDADSSDDSTTTGRHGNQLHIIKIDQKIPSISSASSGIGLDTSGSSPADKANVRDTIKVTFDGNVKASSVSASDFKVTFSGSGGTFVPASVQVNGDDVYLDLDSTIPSDNTPTVAIQGTIQDIAGNSTDAGSNVAADALDPVLTVTRSAGSGSGTGSEAADSLTKNNMTFSITSDEDLQGPPTLTVTNLTGPATLFSGLPTAQGGNVWTATVSGSSSANGDIAVQVVGTDVATNAATIGDTTTKAYKLDLSLPTATSTPANAGSTTQSNPFLTSDFGDAGETSSVSIVEATLDDVDVTSQVVASADSKTFFFQPATALTNDDHTYVVKAIDAAGNESTTTTTFTKSDRTDFTIELFAGWNSVSFPSNPLDSDVNTVLSNTGVKQVVAYDATTPSQPWRIASKVGSAAYTSQTTPGLTNVTAGPGYWVETSNFEDQDVALEGPTGPGDARPGLTTIATGNGWNLVGVVDQSRSQTQSSHKGATLSRPDNTGAGVNVTSSTYFNTVNNGRAYTFDTVTSKFRELVGANAVTIGTGIWVFISPQDNGQLPHIVP